MDKRKFIDNFFRTYYKQLLAITYNRVGDIQESKDIVMNVLTAVFEKSLPKKPDLMEGDKLFKYVSRSILNKEVDHYRYKKKFVNLEQSFDILEISQDKEEDYFLDRPTLGQIVEKANLNPLESKMLELILLDKSIKESAQILNITSKRVKSIRATMMRKLREVVRK